MAIYPVNAIFHCLNMSKRQVPVASWLVCLILEQVFRVQALAGDFCVVFLGKMLYSYSASLHPGVYMSTGELTAGG